jgi:hypothetical protein
MEAKKTRPTKGERLGWKSIKEQRKVSFSKTLENSEVFTRTDFSPNPILLP